MTNHKISPLIWLLIIYYSLTASVLSFILWYKGIAKVPASVAGLFTVFMPVSSALIGVTFLHESFTWKHAIGMVLAITAIYIGVRNPQQKIKEPEKG